VALVTGASKGIGRALSIGLAEAGADVVLAGRSHGELEDLAYQIRSGGRRALAVVTDMRHVTQIQAMVTRAVEEMGKVDVLVNNAGVSLVKKSTEVTEEEWDSLMEVNLKGVFFSCQAVGIKMIEQRYGKIINISSTFGVVGHPQRAAYCASKGGVTLLTKALALEWAPLGINVNAIAPTIIRTPSREVRLQVPEILQQTLSRIPMGRIGEPEDVVGATVFLASSASDFITGTVLLVDGGWTAI